MLAYLLSLPWTCSCIKDKVDYLFIPRMVNVDSDKTLHLSKVLGLPDMIKASIPNLPKLFLPAWTGNRDIITCIRPAGRSGDSLKSLPR